MSCRMLGAAHTYQQFPGGEPHVVLINKYAPEYPIIEARIRDFNDLGELLALTDALKRGGAGKIVLRLPYFPGARQDRPFPGGAFTLKIYADIINAQGYSRVEVLDPHSLVTQALVNNLVIRPATGQMFHFFRKNVPYDGVIAPDAGASARAFEVAQYLNSPLLHAHKVRDAKTGKLSGFECPSLPSSATYLVVDDICDGGGTFLGLAEAIQAGKTRCANFGVEIEGPQLDLWVSHGIFSKGLAELFKHFRNIGTTDSFYQPTGEDMKLYGPRLYVGEVK